ncbi:la-related protein 4b, partial [Nannochloropsis gaditana]
MSVEAAAILEKKTQDSAAPATSASSPDMSPNRDKDNAAGGTEHDERSGSENGEGLEAVGGEGPAIQVSEGTPGVKKGLGEVAPITNGFHGGSTATTTVNGAVEGEAKPGAASRLPSAAGTHEGDVRAVRQALEHYLSLAYLRADQGFLASYMNPQMFIPLSVLVTLPALAALSPSLSLVVAALKDHPTLTLNEEQSSVRPNIHVPRTTVILREISSETPEEEIRSQLLGWEGCPEIKSLRKDVGDTWFVGLEDEGAAKWILERLRERLWHGKPIRARLKSENVVNKAFLAGEGVGTDGGDEGGRYARQGGDPTPTPPGRKGGKGGGGGGGGGLMNGSVAHPYHADQYQATPQAHLPPLPSQDLDRGGPYPPALRGPP